MQFVKKYRFIIAALAVVVLGAAILYLTLLKPAPLPDNTTFKSDSFSFSYPRTDTAKEYAPDVVSIGRAYGDGLDPYVEVVKYQNDPDEATPSSFDAFMKRQASSLCGADGPIDSLHCTEVGVSAFTSTNGLSGQKLDLTLVHTNLKSGTTTSETYGPLYVFNTTASSTPEDPLRYSAIFVYPSLASFVVGSTTPALLDQVVNSLSIISK